MGTPKRQSARPSTESIRMKTKFVLLLLVALALPSLRAQPQYVDCSCLSTQAVLATNACQAFVPDMCQFTNCFTSTPGTSIPLTCSQTPVAGTQVGPGTHPITVTVTDPNGVSSQCVVNFTVTGISSGQFDLICASNKTVLCDQPWSFDPPTPTNYCCPQSGTPNGGVTIVVLSTTTNGSCPAMITQTWEATDACGKRAMCSQTVTVVDNVAPVITCASNQTVQCNTMWNFGTPAASDNCTAPSDLFYNVISTTTNFGCGETYVATQVWQVQDLCGNTSYCTQRVAVVDMVAPMILCASNKTVECRTQWSFDTPTVSDNCSNAAVPPTNITVTVLSTVTNGFCPQTITRTWQATDGCGNSSQCSQTVTVVDTTPPLLDCNCLRSNPNVPLNVVGCSNAIPDLCSLLAQCATDNCGPLTCAQSPAAGTIVGPGTHPITVTVYDCASNSASCVVSFVVTAPSGGCNPCTNVVQVFNTGMGGASGNVLLAAGTPDPNYTLVTAPGTCTTAQVIDTNTMPAPPWVGTGPNSQWIGGGSNANCDAGFYIYRLAVNITCPSNALISGQWTADDFAEVFLNGLPTGFSAPSSNYPYSFTGWQPLVLTNGFVCGTNYIDFYVTNWHGVVNPTGFRAEITNVFDSCCICTDPTCPITIRCPTNMTVVTCSNSAVVNYTPPTVFNPCQSNVSVICTPPSGSSFPLGTNTVTCFVGDATGVIYSQCSFEVAVISSQCDFFNGDFSLQVPVNSTGNGWTSSGLFGGAGWDPNEGNAAPSFLLNNVGDPATDPMVSQRLCCFRPGQCYTIRGQRKVQAWFGDTNLSFAVLLDGGAILQLPVPTNPADTNWHDFSVSFTATMPCHTIGFASEINGTDVSYWIDNLRIECCSTTTNNCVSITCSTNRVVQTCTNGAPVSYTPPVAASSCGTAITNISCTPPSGSFFPLGTTTVTCTATDAQGNSASCSFQVIVNSDTTPPNCPPFSMSVTGCPPRVPNFQTNGLVTDNCTPSGQISVAQDIPPGTPMTPGQTTVVILTICDAAGNCRVCDVVITPVSSAPPPKIKCPKDITVLTCSNSAVVNYKVSANVPPAFISCVPPSGSNFPLGTNMVVCTATNACGESVSCSFKVIVKYGLSVNPNVTITAGVPDNFALPVDAAFRTACLTSAFSGFTGWKSFDAPQDNRIFGHRFTGLPANIVQAELVIRMKPGGNTGSDNDGLFIGLPSSCAPSSWSFIATIKTIATAVPATGGTWVSASNGPTTFTISLSSPAWLAKLNADQFLDVAVHDDTTVDWARLRLWTCPPKHPGIGIPFTPIGNASVALRTDSDDPDEEGPAIFITPDANEGASGILLEPGTPRKLTFTTWLPFEAPEGAEFAIALPTTDPVAPYEPMFSFKKRGEAIDLSVSGHLFVADSSNFRSVAVGTNGHLFSSTEGTSQADLDQLVRFTAVPGVSNIRAKITIDCDTREVTLEIPECLWTARGRKGWDGCIYGPDRPVKKPSARLVLGGDQPLVPRVRLGTVPVALLARGFVDVPVENPSVESQGRKWGDGHVTLMKAYDDEEDAASRRIEWTSFGEGGGVHVDLGRAASFSLGLHHFQNGDVPTQDQFLRVFHPPRGLTNRPTPPKDIFGFVQGAGGVQCSADFSDISATGVRVELWRDGMLVGAGEGDGPVIPPESPLTISRWPERYGRPAINEGLFLRSSELFDVSGLTGDEIRILPLFGASAGKTDSPGYVTGLEIQTSEGMESMAYGLDRTLACTPGPLNIERGVDGTTLTWTSEGFRLQGAESVNGPWYDLGVESPVLVEPSALMRYFRLVCD